jgi:hypothetical protein
MFRQGPVAVEFDSFVEIRFSKVVILYQVVQSFEAKRSYGLLSITSLLTHVLTQTSQLTSVSIIHILSEDQRNYWEIRFVGF